MWNINFYYVRPILDFNLVIYYLGLSATYVMFIAEVIKQFVDYYYYEIEVWIYIYLMAGLLLIVQLLQTFKSMVLWIMIPIAFSHIGSYNKWNEKFSMIRWLHVHVVFSISRDDTIDMLQCIKY